MSTVFTLSKAGLEIYTVQETTEDDSKKKKEEKEDSKDKKKEEKKEEETPTTDSEDVTNNFKLDKGEINHIDFIGEIYTDGYEEDYADISCNASVSVPIDYLNYFYKGRRMALKKGLMKDKLNWDDMSSVVDGFCTELTYSKDKVDVKIMGMNRLLDEEGIFKFKKTKRSEIVKQIIEKAGLIPKIDITGLKDDVINFTSGSEEKKSSSSKADPNASADIQEIVNSVCGDATSDMSKFKKLHKWGRDNITYAGYECAKYGPDPDKCLKNKGHLNCGDTAILMYAIYTAAGLDCYIIHGDYHFWNIVTIDGTKYASDCTGTRSINEVWSGNGHHNTPFGGSKANPKAICG